MLTPAEIAGIAAKALDDKKARDVKVLSRPCLPTTSLSATAPLPRT